MLEYVPRALARTVRRALLTFPAVLVTGARQTGKTTLLREEFGAGYAYVSLFTRTSASAWSRAPSSIFLDPGLVSFLLGLHAVESILQGPAAGALIETAVVAEWVKAFREQGETPPIYFWRASSGLEIDFVIERNDRLYGLEVKATATPLPGHAESLAQWLVLAGPEARGVLACRVDVPTALRPGLRAVPWHLAW